MKIMKTYKFRLYPNDEQKVLINKTFGCIRLVYNIMLSKKKENYKLSKFYLNKEISKLYIEYPFLKEVDSMSLRCVVSDLCIGFDKYYKKQEKDSYRTNYISSIHKGKIYRNLEIIEGKVINTTIKKEMINATFSEIIRKLEYKCKYENKIFYQVNTYYPSSQICSRCGNKDKIMKDINKREYKCSKCSVKIDRDINVSINILVEGINRYYKEKYSN